MVRNSPTLYESLLPTILFYCVAPSTDARAALQCFILPSAFCLHSCQIYASVDAGRQQINEEPSNETVVPKPSLASRARDSWMGRCAAALEVLSAQGTSATAAASELVPPLVELLRLLWHGRWAEAEVDDAEYLAQVCTLDMP